MTGSHLIINMVMDLLEEIKGWKYSVLRVKSYFRFCESEKGCGDEEGVDAAVDEKCRLM